MSKHRVLSLSITDGVNINLPAVLSSMQRIYGSCVKLKNDCYTILAAANKFDSQTQSEINDRLQKVISSTTEDLEWVADGLDALRISVEDLIQKLKWLERMATKIE